MITGNIIGTEIYDNSEVMQAVNPATGEYLPEKFSVANDLIINSALDKAVNAFPIYDCR